MENQGPFNQVEMRQELTRRNQRILELREKIQGFDEYCMEQIEKQSDLITNLEMEFEEPILKLKETLDAEHQIEYKNRVELESLKSKLNQEKSLFDAKAKTYANLQEGKKVAQQRLAEFLNYRAQENVQGADIEHLKMVIERLHAEQDRLIDRLNEERFKTVELQSKAEMETKRLTDIQAELVKLDSNDHPSMKEPVKKCRHCRYLYHTRCIDRWVYNNGTCPNCQEEFNAPLF